MRCDRADATIGRWEWVVGEVQEARDEQCTDIQVDDLSGMVGPQLNI